MNKNNGIQSMYNSVFPLEPDSVNTCELLPAQGVGIFRAYALSRKAKTSGRNGGLARSSAPVSKFQKSKKRPLKTKKPKRLVANSTRTNVSSRKPTPPLVRREISGVILLAFGLLLLISVYFVSVSGFIGELLNYLIGGLFGVTGWLIPIIVIGQGLYRIFARSGNPLWFRFFSLVFLMMIISGMFQAGAHPVENVANVPLLRLMEQFFQEGANTLDASSGQSFLGGGLLGGLVGVPLLFLFHRAGTMVVLAALGLILTLIITRISFVDAAISLARGTKGTINGLTESSRARRLKKQERYEAQTRLSAIKLDAAAATKFGSGSNKDRQQPAIERERGAKFLDVDLNYALVETLDEDEAFGPSIRYPASFVHLDKDVGDLRTDPYSELPAYADSSESMYNEGFVDPVTGELATPNVWSTVFGDKSYSNAFLETGDARISPVSEVTAKNQEHLVFEAADKSGSAGLSLSKGEQNNEESSGLSLAQSEQNHEESAGLSLTQSGQNNEESSGLSLSRGEQNHEENAGYFSTFSEAIILDNSTHSKDWEKHLLEEDERRRTEEAIPPHGSGKLESVSVKVRPYTFPPVFLIKQSKEDEQNMRRIRATAEENARKLENTLESFGIGAKVVHVSVGPAITRYELQPAPGIKVSRIVNLTDDIALNLASSGVRIEAPIPGKAAIGVEVPNKEVAPISLRSVLESQEFNNHPSKLAVALGKDISGEIMVADLAKMPHLLIAGATGSGKSVCINSIVVSLLYKANPQEVKLLMIDPKVVELGVYNGIPHLLIPVVTDPNKAAGALRWAVQEMVLRYKLFAEKGVRDLSGYNRVMDEIEEGVRLPQIVVLIDELADLMMVAPHDVEDSICRLAQMARAAGMHLVIATQRPSVNVITGVIKANIPSRIAFSVSSQVDSRTIIDMAGAEKLLGKGDMLYYPVGIPKPLRVKGTFISDKEVESVVSHVKAQMLVKYDEDIIENINENLSNESADQEPEVNDGLLDEAVEALIDSGQASVSFIQRRFKVGYARAGRIIDQMAEKGIISGYEGSKPRRVLITRDMWNELRMQKEIRLAEQSRSGRNAEHTRLRTLPAEAPRHKEP